MKQKIKAALQQKYPQLGLADEVFEGVASAVETLITDEANIPAFVEGAEGMLKRYQADADKLRGHKKLSDDLAAEKQRAAELEAKIKELEGKPTPAAPAEPTAQPAPADTPDFAKLISDAVSAAVKPLQDKIDAFESEKSQLSVVETAKKEFFANKIADAYPKQRDLAWKQALKLYEANGKTWSKDDLTKEVTDSFNEFCSAVGIDSQKPLPSEGNGGSDNHDFSKQREYLQSEGLIPKENK